jgi:hypothetical protein
MDIYRRNAYKEEEEMMIVVQDTD